MNDEGATVTTTAPTLENLILNLSHELTVRASLDATFNATVNNTVNDLAVQTDGKVVIGGSFTTVGVTTVGDIARLNVDGTLDAAFTTAGGVGFNGTVNTVVLQPDGRILVGGSFTTYAGLAANRFARLNTGGSRSP